MTKYWEKLGLLYQPRGLTRHPKLISHASNPLPIHLKDDIYRIFFSGRDSNNRSSVGAVDIDIINRKIITEHTKPFFEHGEVGSFFSEGVSIGNCYEVNGTRYILFMGWQVPTDGHWRGNIGRLVLTPELLLYLDSQTPFLEVDSTDPISLSYPWVLSRANGGYDMYYGSTLSWEEVNGEMLHVINHAFSIDGHNWIRNGRSLPYEVGIAQAFSRPSVITNINGDYEMWFSVRNGQGDKYRIGYANSFDGIEWNLEIDYAGINKSALGWDSEMIEYPFVFDHKNKRYMLYNGNGYGKTGFGLAVLRER